jgi:glycerol uptake facilitator protein
LPGAEVLDDLPRTRWRGKRVDSDTHEEYGRAPKVIRHCRMSIGVRRGFLVQQHSLSQRAAAEVLGTALLVLVGPGSVVATLVLAGKSTPAVTGADLLGISFAFGFIIAAMVYAIGKVSGCHINPAVTFALAATKRFPWREVPAYWLAQVAGAVIGALGIWAVFAHTGIDLGMGQTSFNQDATTWASAIFAEGIGTFMLMYAILGIVDSRSPGDFAGLIIGGVVVAIIMVVGPITGASLNPARAFGPELVSALGKGTTHWNQLIPVYVLPGLVGSALAAFAYDFMTKPRVVARPIREAVSHPDAVVAPTQPAATH